VPNCNSSLPDDNAGKSSSGAVKAKRFNKFGEEVLSIEDVFPDKHPGIVLKGFRQRDDLTQQQLADLLNTKQSRICELESGTRSISKSMAQKLAKLFETSYKVFL
jgi:DNA-binding XRE family transcriptional regulator